MNSPTVEHLLLKCVGCCASAIAAAREFLELSPARNDLDDLGSDLLGCQPVSAHLSARHEALADPLFNAIGSDLCRRQLKSEQFRHLKSEHFD